MQAVSYRTRIYQSVSIIFISVPSLKTCPTVRRADKTGKEVPGNPISERAMKESEVVVRIRHIIIKPQIDDVIRTGTDGPGVISGFQVF